MKIFSIFFLAISISVTGILVHRKYNSNEQSRKAVARNYLDSARYHLDRSNHKKAEELLIKVIEFDIDLYTVESYAWLGEIKSREGRYEESRKLFQKASTYQHSRVPDWRSAFINNGFAWSYLQKGEYDSALIFANKSLEDTLPVSQATAKRTLGVIYRRKGDFPKSIEHQLSALRIATAIGNNGIIVSTLNGLGNTYSEIGEFDTGMKYFDSCIVYSKKINLTGAQFSAMINLALSKLQTGELDEAETIIEEVLDEAEKKRYTQIKPQAYQYLGGIYKERKKYRKSIEYYALADSAYTQRQSWPDKYAVDTQLAEVYMMMGDLKMADKYVKSVIDHATASKNSQKLFFAQVQLFKLDSMRGDFKKANVNVRKAWHLRDSIYGLEKREMIEEMSQKYAAEQNQKTIEYQKALLEKERNDKLIIVIVALVGTFSVLSLYLLYRFRQKNKLDKLQEESNRKRVDAILETQERVQQSIARDLHDGLVQTLGAVKLSLESILPEANEVLNRKLTYSSTLLDEACHEVRNMSHQLLPHSLKGGLPDALQDLAERSLRKSMQQLEFKVSGPIKKINPAVEIHLFRIAQELVNNILRHSMASSVFMYITFLKETLVLWVEDNGQGFQYSKDTLGVGLLNITARLEMINGELNMETSPGKGTSVSIRVPLNLNQ